MTGYRASMWIRCAGSYCATRRTPQEHPRDEYPDLLFIGEPEELGMLAKAAVWVIYKRNDVADWAQFAEVFGAPIREYTYPTDDDEARQRALADAESTGSMSVFVHAQKQ